MKFASIKGIPFSFDHRIILNDGGVRWVHEQAEFTYDEKGIPIEMIGISMDITESKLAEEKLRKSKKNLDALISNTNDLVWSIDPGFRLMSANNSFLSRIKNILNIDLKEGDFAIVMPAGSKEYREWMEYYKRALSGESFTTEIKSDHTGGEATLFELRINPIVDEDKIVGASCFTRDITEWKRIENKIRGINEQYKILLKATNDAVWDWHLDNSNVTWNSGLQSLFGYDKRDEQEKVDWWYQNLHPDDLDRVTRELDTTFSEKRANWSSNYRFRCADGSYKYVYDRGYAIYEKDLPVRMIGAMQDIHELTEYRMSLEKKVFERTQELHQALEKEKELVEMKSRFVSIASHEFRTPLSTIEFAAGFLSMYRARISEDEFQRKLKSIETQVHHMTSLLDDVLLVGKTDSGKIEVSKTHISLRSFFGECIDNVRRAHKESHEVVIAFNGVPDELYTDGKLLNNIFSNLLGNAMKFSPGKKQVSVNVRGLESSIEVEVIDQGIGISPEDADAIFEPFSRGTNVAAISGTGLGLTIVKKAVDLLGGTITMHSTLERGTTFTVTLRNTA